MATEQSAVGRGPGQAGVGAEMGGGVGAGGGTLAWGRKTAPFWRTDTRALVGAVVLGVAFVLVQQVAHRIDAVLWPTLIIIGGITWATFTGLITLIYRQPGGIIMGETQALVAVATGLSPLALFFIPANGFGSLAYGAVAWRLSMERWSHHFLAQLACNVVGNACVAVGLYVVLGLPTPVVLVSSAVTAAAGTVGSTILTRRIYTAVRRSGLA